MTSGNNFWDEGDALAFGSDKYWADIGVSFENQMSWSKIPLLVQTNFINRINGILSGNGLTSWNTDIAGWRMPKVLQTTRVAILQTAPTNPVLESTPKSHESGRKFYDPVRDSSRIPDQAGESSN